MCWWLVSHHLFFCNPGGACHPDTNVCHTVGVAGVGVCGIDWMMRTTLCVAICVSQTVCVLVCCWVSGTCMCVFLVALLLRLPFLCLFFCGVWVVGGGGVCCVRTV